MGNKEASSTEDKKKTRKTRTQCCEEVKGVIWDVKKFAGVFHCTAVQVSLGPSITAQPERVEVCFTADCLSSQWEQSLCSEAKC